MILHNFIATLLLCTFFPPMKIRERHFVLKCYSPGEADGDRLYIIKSKHSLTRNSFRSLHIYKNSCVLKKIAYLHISHSSPWSFGIRLSLTRGVSPIVCKILSYIRVLYCLQENVSIIKLKTVLC